MAAPMPAPVVPPAPPERRALGRAALATALLHGAAAVTTIWFLSSALAPDAPTSSRLQAIEDLGLGFRLGMLLESLASLSLLVLTVAWARACRPGGLAGAALPLVTVAVSVDLGAQFLYAWLLPRILATGDPTWIGALDGLARELMGLPGVLLYATGVALLLARSARRRLLPPALLTGGGVLLVTGVLTGSAVLAGWTPQAWGGRPLWTLALVLWSAALGGWCRSRE